MSIFGDSSLFDEFEKEAQPSDKILKQKLLHDDGLADNLPANGEFGGSSTGSEGGSDSEQEFQLTSTSKITGVGSVVKSLSAVHASISEQETDEMCVKLKRQVDKLTRENLLLKKRFKMIQSKSVNGECPAVQVIFMNHKMSRKNKTEIGDFIYHLMQNDRPDEELPYLHLRPTSLCLSKDSIEEIVSNKEKIIENQSNTAIGCEQYYRDFIFDSMGWPLVEYNPSLTDGWCVPIYNQIFDEALPIEDEGSKPKKVVKKAACFNCGGDHTLRECPERKDMKKIQRARQEFQESMSSSKKQRYILDERDVTEKFKAGQISDNLKEALGIQDKQLPPFLYQMRILGYPPGWLKEAEVYSSGVLMFDKHGKALSDDNDDDSMAFEDGEIENKEKQQYDFTKLISYPGFNVDPQKGTIDECRKLGMPEMQENQRRERFELTLTPAAKPGSGKKRKQTSDDCPSDKKKLKVSSSAEMDLVPSDDSQLEEKSILLLEDEKEKIKAELAEMVGCERSSNPDESFVPPLPPTPEMPALPPGTPPVTPQPPHINPSQNGSALVSESVNISSNDSSPLAGPSVDYSTPKSFDRKPFHSVCSSDSLSSAFGTPVLEDNSPASNEGKGLPEASKFAAGITEHLPFENLPEATGKFNHMKKVLSSVRSQLDKS